jgi:CheY-like chemotaxis protein
MPVMDGWGLLDIIHEEGFNKKLSYYGYSSVDQREKTRHIVFKNNHFVEKPFSKADLQELNLGFFVQFVN